MSSLLRALVVAGAVISTFMRPNPLAAQDSTVVHARPLMATTRMDVEPYVSLHLDHVPLAAAISVIRRQSGVNIGFSQNILPSDRYVSVQVENVTVSEALRVVLRGTDVKITQLPDGKLLLFKGSPADAVQGSGTVVGTVTDAKTVRPLRGAIVTIDDTIKRAVTGDDGRYRITGVSGGAHRVAVRLVGFARQTRIVTVGDKQTMTVDFALASSVNTLDQIVVTATGAQRYRELGHVVAKIDADSLVREAPITSLSELLTARVPGLAVYSGNGGVVGGDVALRLRGQTTTNLDPQPIVIVDGVRYNSATRDVNNNVSGNGSRRPFSAEPRSPLNDINVNDIETVEVVKGPSASTLYGPDASNGVIIITTKRGKPGKTTWHVYAYPDLATKPTSDVTSAAGYRAWGHDPNTGKTVTFNCQLVQQIEPALCVLDSITTLPTASNSPRYSVLAKDRPQWHTGGNVSGGTQAFTYFFSSNYDSETGSLQLSPLAQEFLRQELGTQTLSDAIRNPNTQQTLTLHTDVSAQLTPVATVGVTAGYTQATQRAISISSIYNATYGRGVIPLNIDTTNFTKLAGAFPTNAFLRSTQDNVRRLLANGHGGLQPVPWLTMSMDVGTDLTSSIDRGVEPVGAEGPSFTGAVHDYRSLLTNRTANFGLTALAHPGILSFRSSAGVNYIYNNLDGTDLDASDLSPGSTSVSTAITLNANQEWTETASLGTYAEEVVGVNDRLFVTGSLRVDGSTTFGDAYHPRPYPKVGASWIVTDEPWLKDRHLPGLDELRLRYSFGAASRYPTSSYKNGQVNPGVATIGGTDVQFFDRTKLANPLIRPERTRESEYGADLTIARNVQLGLTWYRRRVTDQINQLTVPFGFLQQWANVGDLAAHGFEATMNAKVLESNRLAVELNAAYSHTTNKVLSLGSATGFMYPFGSLVVGYPLDASFGTTVVSVADTSGGHADQMIGYDEVTVSPVHYLGVFAAPNVYTLTPVVSLFGARIRVSSLFDRQTGGVQLDPFIANCGVTGLCIAPYLKSTPLMEQAQFLGVATGATVVSSDFTRWRELTIAADVPRAVREKLGLSRASVSVQGRNLLLWTRYKGTDPESIPGFESQGVRSAQSGGVGIPQGRSWALRFDLSP